MSADDSQIGGVHYQKHKVEHQPWNVLQSWLTAEEYRGFLKGTAIVYLAREQGKGKDEDIAKAEHFLRKLLEVLGGQG